MAARRHFRGAGRLRWLWAGQLRKKTTIPFYSPNFETHLSLIIMRSAPLE
jgi:hypothetical protein